MCEEKEKLDPFDSHYCEERKLSDGRIKNTFTGEVFDPPDYE